MQKAVLEKNLKQKNISFFFKGGIFKLFFIFFYFNWIRYGLDKVFVFGLITVSNQLIDDGSSS